jgi:L-methionine (R)-S-oxide reductase
MYDFKPAAGSAPAELYRELLAAADALTAGEPDAVANMANVAALIWELLPDLNWAGFYGVAPKAAANWCSGRSWAARPASASPSARASAARGGGKAPRSWSPMSTPSPATSPATRRASELVVPVLRDGAVIAVIDLDSPSPARFTGRPMRRDRGARARCFPIDRLAVLAAICSTVAYYAAEEPGFDYCEAYLLNWERGYGVPGQLAYAPVVAIPAAHYGYTERRGSGVRHRVIEEEVLVEAEPAPRRQIRRAMPRRDGDKRLRAD